MDVRIKEATESRTAVVVVEPMDLSKFMACFDAVYRFLGGGIEVTQTGQNVARYDHGTRMEVGVEVDRSFEPSDGVVPSHLPGGRVAHATHTGGFDTLRETYATIADWCKEHRHATTGVAWEIYGDPDEAGQVDVEVCLLLR